MSTAPWTDGDKPGCTHRCVKCNQLRFTADPGPAHSNWCRRCRYTHFDEYFGEGAINEKTMEEMGDV